MNVIFLDLEMEQPSNSIIQVGVCVADIENSRILETGSYFIRQEVPLSEYIKGLTRIKQEEVDRGMSLNEAYNKLKGLRDKYGTERNFFTWGGGDAKLIKEQLGHPSDWPFGDRWFDVKTIYQAYQIAQGSFYRGGLAKSLGRLGLKFRGVKHNGCDDATNTAIIFFKLKELMCRKNMPSGV